MKPVGKARGRGIFLFTRLNQISEWKKDHRWKVENPQAGGLHAQSSDECSHDLPWSDSHTYLLMSVR